jgi:hypothetical protein
MDLWKSALQQQQCSAQLLHLASLDEPQPSVWATFSTQVCPFLFLYLNNKMIHERTSTLNISGSSLLMPRLASGCFPATDNENPRASNI